MDCKHSFYNSFDYSELLQRWVYYCPKCGLVKKEKQKNERFERIIKIREEINNKNKEGIR